MDKKLFDKTAKQAKDLRESIAQVSAQFPGAGNQLFGDLVRSLDLFDSRKNLFPEYFSDAKVRPSREERHIRNAEQNLQRQRELLADVKKRKANSLKNPGRSEAIPVEAIEAAQERVRIAEMQLARAKGEYQKYADSQKQKLADEIAADRAEVAEQNRSWQEGWRSGDWINQNWVPKKG